MRFLYSLSRFCFLLLIVSMLMDTKAAAQVKILFDATKAETAGNADWVIDADVHNLYWNHNGPQVGSGNTGSNPQQFPTPLQSTVNSGTAETYWEGAISAWGIDCVNYGYEVETLPYNGLITYGNGSNPQDLSYYKVFVIDEPNVQFTTSEKNALINFVSNGGGLFMISDHQNSDRNNDGWDSPNIWNDFMANVSPVNPFGIHFDTLDYSQTSTNFATLPNDSLLHGPYGNPTALKFSGATSMTLSPAANSTVTGVIFKTGSSTTGNTDVMVAHARFGRGKVAALADSSPPDDGTGNPASNSLYYSYTGEANGSHQLLIMNATIWLAESDSLTGLAVSPVASVCAGQSVTLTAAGASSYQWAPGGEITASITVSPGTSTVYTVTGMVNGNPETATVSVNVESGPAASFSPSISGGTVVFSNHSSNATTYSWNFGDGSGAVSTSSPTYTYTASGTYTVVLTATNACGSTTSSQPVTVTVTGIDALATDDDFELYKASSNTLKLYIRSESANQPLEVYDLTGQLLLSKRVAKLNTEYVDISTLAQGLYLAKIGNAVRKFTK
ncbi:MAG: C-terminal target protein [Bacteroidota bacterium]|nr:C-terminal target protein [Bacteroidota bacterium]